MKQDTVAGFQNLPAQVIAVTTETPILVPTVATAPFFPSPAFPLSYASNPSVVYTSVPPDISSGSDFDGHPFEVVLAFTASSTATTNTLVNLWNVKQSAFSSGLGSTGYTLGALGTGCLKVNTGTATANLTSSVTINYVMRASFLWDSLTKILSWTGATQYQNGVVVANAANANITAAAITDLNFTASFTFASAATTTVNVKEFVINRL